MAKLTITKEALQAIVYFGVLNLKTVLNKDIFFSPGMVGDVRLLAQAAGYFGCGYTGHNDFSVELSIVVIADALLQSDSTEADIFRDKLQKLLNKPANYGRNLTYVSESDFIAFLVAKAKEADNQPVLDFVKHYKKSKKEKATRKCEA